MVRVCGALPGFRLIETGSQRRVKAMLFLQRIFLGSAQSRLVHQIQQLVRLLLRNDLALRLGLTCLYLEGFCGVGLRLQACTLAGGVGLKYRRNRQLLPALQRLELAPLPDLRELGLRVSPFLDLSLPLLDLTHTDLDR